MLPDVNYKAESPEGNQSQNMNAQGPALLLFLFVDFQSDVPVQQAKIWGMCRKMQQPDWVWQALGAEREGVDICSNPCNL